MADEYYYGATEMESGPSFKFSHNDLIIYYTKDKNFRKLINTGQYIYYNGYLVLKNSEYINQLDTFIDSDLGEFCISKGIVTNRRSLRRYPLITHQKSNFFSRKVKGPLVIPSAKKPKEEQGDEFKPKRPISVFRHAENHLKFEDLDKEAFEHYVKTFGKPNGDTFGKCLKVYLKRDGITQAKLAEAVNVSDNTISRICTDRYIPPLQLAVAICIALHLYPYESDYMLDLAGHSLNGASPEIAVYKLILNIFYLKEVEECNAFLEEYGLKTLTKSVVEIRK